MKTKAIVLKRVDDMNLGLLVNTLDNKINFLKDLNKLKERN